MANFPILGDILLDGEDEKALPGEILQEVKDHLKVLSTNFEGYFSDIDDLSTESVWIQNPFSFDIYTMSDNDLVKDELIEFQEDQRKKADFGKAGLDFKQFWCVDWSPDLMRSPKMPLAQGTKGKTNTEALLDLMEKTGYNMIQGNGQRRFGPPPDWIGPPPPRGCEVFIAKIPRDAFEDELVPVFESVGQIYELRLMMEFNGENRGYAFLTYTNQQDSQSAIDTLNNYELRPGRPLGVCISTDNRRLFIGGLPRDKGQEEVLEEMKKVTNGVKDAVVYPGVGLAAADRKRGFAFVEYVSHRSAAMARKKLLPGPFHLWGHLLQVDWGNPEREMDPEVSCVRTLNVENLSPATSERVLCSALEKALHIGAGGDRAHTGAIEKIEKAGNFAIVHFRRQEDALWAQNSLHGAQIDGAQVEVSLARPAISQHAGDGGGVMKDHAIHREPWEPQTHSRMEDNMSRRVMNPIEARLHSGGGIPEAPRHLAVDLGEAFWRTPSSKETDLSPQEIDLAVTCTATVRLELWCSQRGLPPPSYTPFNSLSSAGPGQKLYGYMVYIYGVPGGIFAPEEVGSMLDGAKELAAWSVLNKLGNIK
uniref:probable RNA-binding protein 46 n=1 Tax=Myxine glutinosa TaxID=7769 RepID=UPI00358FFC58